MCYRYINNGYKESTVALETHMKKFVEFQFHDYMDYEPITEVRTFTAETFEAIEEAARKYEKHMQENWSGGTTKFIKIMSAQEAEEWLDKESRARIWGEHGWEMPTPEQIKEYHDELHSKWVECYR